MKSHDHKMYPKRIQVYSYIEMNWRDKTITNFVMNTDYNVFNNDMELLTIYPTVFIIEGALTDIHAMCFQVSI